MVQIKRIVCPVDFSEVSRHAFDRALAVARSYNGEILLVHVLPLPSHVPAVPYGPEGPGPFGFEVPDRRGPCPSSRDFSGWSICVTWRSVRRSSKPDRFTERAQQGDGENVTRAAEDPARRRSPTGERARPVWSFGGATFAPLQVIRL